MPTPPASQRSEPPGNRLRVALATLGGNLFLVLGSLVMGTLAILTGWIPPRGTATFWCARLWARGLLAAGGVRARREFEAPLEPDRRFIFMANHQSLFDIPALLATLPGQTRFLAKRSLFRIPVFGWAIAVGGFVPVDREDRSRARASFSAAAERLRSGASVLIFPEETRSLDGQLLPFRRGGFLLALKSGLPIVPVGIRGTFAVQPKGRVTIRPGRVTVRYGAPVEPQGYPVREKGELMVEVRRQVARLAGLAEGEPRAALGIFKRQDLDT